MGLELYGKIEPLLGFEKEIHRLYELYIEILYSWEPESLIDIGCGSGRFMQYAKENLHLKRVFGVDLSETMVMRAQKKGLDVKAMDICDVKERFSAATAVFDVLNYLDNERLCRFMGCVEKLLEPGGIFVADINTLYGFEEVAPGALVKHGKESLLVLDSVFEEDSLKTSIDYFEKEAGGCYRRESDTVLQYYHEVESVADSSDLELIQIYPVTLFGDEPDKEVLVFRKKQI